MHSPGPDPLPRHVELGSKTFAMEDQLAMARWCGDHNPMHVDAVAARRLITGLPVVHGAHLALEALARCATKGATGGKRVARVRAEFAKPVSVGDEVRFEAHGDGRTTTLKALVGALDHMVLTLWHVPADEASPAALPSAEPLLAWSETPFDEPVSRWLDRTVALRPVDGGLPAASAAAALLGDEGAAFLGQLSTVVGMACPGLHSVFASLDVSRRHEPGAGRFSVVKHDARFGLVRIRADGPWAGEVRAFVRAAPRAQVTMDEVAQRVPREWPEGHCSWVLGGSRGLGELAAKLLAAAGSDVVLSYASGRDDAERVAEQINRAGRGRARCVHYVAGESDPAMSARAWPWPQAVLYFATPRIARQRSALYEPDRLRQFLGVYCDEPARLARALEDAAAERAHPTAPVRLFNPSSTYVDELPAGMVEYAMAKAASEVQALDLNKRLKHVRMITARLPRMPTDQTNGLIADDRTDALAVLWPVLRQALQP
jgi:MaoC like domain